MANSSKVSDREKAKKYERAKMLANERARRYKARKTEAQLEKKREQDRKSAAARRKSVKDMSEKEKKSARKEWRNRKRVQREKQKETEKMLENTPPVSEDEDGNLISPRQQSRQQDVGKKIARRNRAKIVKELKDSKEENKKLRQKLEKYKKRLHREKKKNESSTGVSPSPRKQLKNILGSEKVSPKVKKQLFSGLVLESQIKKQVKSVSSKSRLRQQITKAVGNELLQKYRLQNRFHTIVPYKYNAVLMKRQTPLLQYDRKNYTTLKVNETKLIRSFFEDDTVSKMMPGKKDYIKHGKVKMQKRVLLDSLFNLYDRFVKETKLKISRSVFYRCRPWWVYRPKMRDRETCACQKHENAAFLFLSLKQAKVIKNYKDLNELIKSTVCCVQNEKCMLGLCPDCKTKKFQYEIEEDDEIKFHKWVNIKEDKIIKGVLKPVQHVEKTSASGTKSYVLNLLLTTIPTFKKHVYYMYHQSKILKNLKENPKRNEILYQIDFSQNYVAKYSTEIQSVHFGASQKQISLHTGARYVTDDNDKAICSTFCTVSDILDHHSHGVWSHLQFVLKQDNTEFPDCKSVHIFSDGPSSQYKNKNNVYLMKLLLPEYFKNLNSFTWNYSESGHGKGVMDGVGGSIKRNADSHALNQKDVTCAKDLVKLFSDSKTKVSEVSPQTFDEIKSMIPEGLSPIEGIMCVRQITWAKNTGVLHFRKLSCFECPPSDKCKHHHLFSIGVDGKKLTTQKKKLITKKKVLKVSDVYSDSDEEKVDDHQQCVTLKKKVEFQDLKSGAFVVVTFTVGKKNKSKDYAAIIQDVHNIDEGEINVMFLKKYGSDGCLFFSDENDVCDISVHQIKGILPTPEVLKKGKRLYHKFAGPIQVC